MSATTIYNPIGWANRMNKNLPGIIASNTRETIEYDAETLWGASAYATRINGGYLKFPKSNYDSDGNEIGVRKSRNRDLMMHALSAPGLISAADRKQGRQARDWHSRTVMVRGLQGELSDFDRNIARVVQLDTVTERLDIAIVASLVNSYKKGSWEEKQKEQLDPSAGYVGDIGSRVRNLKATIIRVVYSDRYDCWFVSAITDTKQSLFFSLQKDIAVGKQVVLTGTVKAYRDKDTTTQLNRVKIH